MQGTGFNAPDDPLRIKNYLALLVDILAEEALPRFLMRVDYGKRSMSGRVKRKGCRSFASPICHQTS